MRRLLALGALVGASGTFAVAMRLWMRTIREDCGRMEYMSAGNCNAIHFSNLWFVSVAFGICAVALAVLILWPQMDSRSYR